MSDEQRAPLINVTDAGPVLVSKAVLAKALSISERTVGNWQKKGVIPFLKISDRFVRFDVAEVRDALDQRYKVQAKANSKAR
jgi:predicted site-specific integrase-resolvase